MSIYPNLGILVTRIILIAYPCVPFAIFVFYPLRSHSCAMCMQITSLDPNDLAKPRLMVCNHWNVSSGEMCTQLYSRVEINQQDTSLAGCLSMGKLLITFYYI